eukprot:Skav210839  [mRNA]  locus=scaffold543:63222:72338:- [translate_table: standard]
MIDALPGELATQKIEKDITNRSQIISATRLRALMQIHCGIAGCTRHSTLLDHWDVSTAFVTETLGKAKVNDVDLVMLPFGTQDKIAGLDVSMNDLVLVNKLDAVNHLLCHHQNSLQAKLPVTFLHEDIFQRRTQQPHRHDVIFAFTTYPKHRGGARALWPKDLTKLSLFEELVGLLSILPLEL